MLYGFLHTAVEFRLKGLRFRVEDLRFRPWDIGFSVSGFKLGRPLGPLNIFPYWLYRGPSISKGQSSRVEGLELGFRYRSMSISKRGYNRDNYSYNLG